MYSLLTGSAQACRAISPPATKWTAKMILNSPFWRRIYPAHAGSRTRYRLDQKEVVDG